MREEFKVVRIEALEQEKIMGSSKEKLFYIPVRYVLEDGRGIIKTHRDTKKKDIVDYLSKLPKEPRGLMVTLTPNGRIESTVQSLSNMMGW